MEYDVVHRNLFSKIFQCAVDGIILVLISIQIVYCHLDL
uniref:Uncharacterized protein n=1 Tax=Arundo donax TaxID=35708 RepID=A0A0A9EFN1_ARUDO